jgi:hypothetical protein
VRIDVEPDGAETVLGENGDKGNADIALTDTANDG